MHSLIMHIHMHFLSKMTDISNLCVQFWINSDSECPLELQQPLCVCQVEWLWWSLWLLDALLAVSEY